MGAVARCPPMPKHLDPGHACACTSGLVFSACCRPYLRGEREAPDAVALMRSRYAAFALENAGYLWRTLHAQNTEKGRPEAEAVRELKRACRAFTYTGFAILDSAPPDAQGCARVLFLAGLADRGRDLSFVERSAFLHDGTGWRYVSGELRAAKELADPLAVRLDTFVPGQEAAEPAAPAR